MNQGKIKNTLMFSSDVSIENFIESLKNRLNSSLPGIESQLKLAPVHRIAELQEMPPEEAIQSSVLLLLYPKDNSLYTHVILRAEYDGVHSGQISLPGGRREQSDQDAIETALREAHEETGIEIKKVRVLGALTRLFINRSNYVVFPFIGFTPIRPDFDPDPFEVQEIIEVDINELLGDDSLISKTIKFKNGYSLIAPGYETAGHFMWGATAMIFSEFLDTIRSIPSE
jgi:8-oxo-dGTP pyrophosphatase MutT (NUDIX family)